jgi:von Willebrand factor type A domain
MSVSIRLGLATSVPNWCFEATNWYVGPVSIGVILDMSGSMGTKIKGAREAVQEFLKASNPQDEFFLITFADRPHVAQDFTQKAEDIDVSTEGHHLISNSWPKKGRREGDARRSNSKLGVTPMFGYHWKRQSRRLFSSCR